MAPQKGIGVVTDGSTIALTFKAKSVWRTLWAKSVFAMSLVAMLLAASPVYAEIDATLEARLERNFARIIFEFDRLPKYSKDLTGTILVIKFEEPVNVSLEPIYKYITRYVSVARRDPDGSAIRLAMSRRFKINLMEAGKKLVVDILPTDWVGLPPPLPPEVVAELAQISKEYEAKKREEERQRKLARAGYKLKIRVGRYKTFSRIVFDWNKFVVASLSRDGEKVRVKFTTKAPIDLSQVQADPPPLLKKIKEVKADTGMELLLKVDPKANVRGFREGLDYVVDLTGVNKDVDQAVKKTLDDVARQKQKKKMPTNAEEIKFSGSQAQNLATEDPIQPMEEAPVITEQDRQQWSADVNTSTAAKKKNSDEKIVDEKNVKADRPPSSYANEEDEILQAQKTESQSTNNQSSADDPKDPVPTKETIEAELKDPSAEESTNKTTKTVRAPDTSEAKPVQTKNFSAENFGDGLKFVFSLEKNAPAAVFRREKTLWAIFDTPEKIDLEGLQERFSDAIRSVEQENIEDAQLVRIKLSKPWLPSVQKDGKRWVVKVGTLVADKAEPLSMEKTQSVGQKNAVVVKLKEPGRLHWLTDPEIGDRLAVVTADAPIRSILTRRNLVDFEALSTAHGLAIKPRVDDLSVLMRLSDVLITRAPGLILSSARDAEAARKGGQNAPLPKERVGYIDFKGWKKGGKENFNYDLSDLENAITDADEKQRNEQRLNLARFYIAHRLAPEVLGTVRLITSSNPEAGSDPAISVLRGAANALMGRYKQADKDLSTHALENDVDASLWRGLIDRHGEKWEDALDEFSNGANVVTHYPEDLQAKFRLAAATAALENKLLSRAADELDAIPAAPLPNSLMAEADLLRGRYLQELGRVDQAIQAYTRSIKAGFGAAGAQARMRTIDLLLKQKKIDARKAVQELESLSIVWRGDNTELGTLNRLANLYADNGDYRKAFKIMKNAVKAFPESQIALQTQDDMKEVFRDLFLYGKGKTIPVTSAIGLFYDYPELTPVGRQGDELIRNLADRLISVELLDQASELLEHQVNNRLRGAARAQVAVRLAMVHLLNAKPELALRTIRQTRQPDLPKETKRARDILEARALGELGRAASAVDLLSHHIGDDVERLRADVYWNAQKWRPAGEQLEKMLGAKWESPESLSKSERFDVLRAAISYSLADDRFALNRLRKKFYNKMIDSDDAESFVLITKPVKSRTAEFNQLVKDIASSSTLDAFMKGFKRRYEESERAGQNPADQTERRPFG